MRNINAKSMNKMTGLLFMAAVTLLTVNACKTREHRKMARPDDHLHGAINHRHNVAFDSNQVAIFYTHFPELEKYRKDVTEVYRQHKFFHIWYDEKGVIEFGQTLYTKSEELDQEGIASKYPYREKIESVFDNEIENTLTQVETELMLTNLYLFYAENVYKGLADSTSAAMGWLLPRKQVEYRALLDSLMTSDQLINRDDSMLIGQYYKLRDFLLKYREIEKNGGWKPVDLDPRHPGYRPGDTSRVILQVRERLFAEGYLKQDSRLSRYDPELEEAVKNFQVHTGKNPNELILPEHIREMNVPVGERIKTIIVNMERCRWISPEFARAKEYIVVNIPAYMLTMVRDGKIWLRSPVVVGKNVTRTVIFSGMMRYIIFSPYWNVPTSIYNKEIKPGMARNKNYLEQHNMEMIDGQVRQKPGKNNSLGQVKFIFPNSNDIYMHDTPAKSLFAQENRAFSHGCIRVGKPFDLAVAILEDDPSWTPERIRAAMNAGRENTVVLKEPIPVYIGYFTAWVNLKGEISFFNDVYQRDDRLAQLMICDQPGQ